MDDEDKDLDFDPDVEEEVDLGDMTIEGENQVETFEVKKHSHVTNFQEASEFKVWVQGELKELERVINHGKDMDKHYRTIVMVLKDAIEKIGTYVPIKASDMEAVIKTVMDMKCTAWKKTMKGIMTGNSKTILKVEEKGEGVLREVEERGIPTDTEEVIDPEEIQAKSDEEK